MYVNYISSIYSEHQTEAAVTNTPQMIHQITDGGLAVAKGIKTLPAVLVDMLLTGEVRRNVERTCPADERNGFILAAGGTIWTGYVTQMTDVDATPKIKVMPISMNQIFAGKTANMLGNFEYISTDATSCVSGHAALHKAKLLLAADEVDNVVVVAVDNSTSQDYLNFFAQQKLVKLLGVDELKFNIGQGANITVVSNYNKNATAKIDGIALVSEQHDTPLGITQTGEGYAKAIEKAGRKIYFPPDFVKTHATYSIDNEIEEKIVKDLYPNAKILNYKLKIGHTMGSSTAIEFDLALQEMSAGQKLLSLGAGMGNVFTAVRATKL